MDISLATKIVGDFEKGRLSRRQLATRLMGLGAAMAAMKGTAWAQATEKATFQATGLDHIALNVTDIPRSREFYVKQLGLRVLRGDDDSSFLGADRDFFLALFHAEEAGMNHYCYSIPSYDPEDVVERLNAAGLRPRREQNRVYFPDPDGLTVQLAGP
jgi:catechol 2,3-dioxygenase-like lactoylglutathione lyase family enzyme